jgi:hypothetical protein
MANGLQSPVSASENKEWIVQTDLREEAREKIRAQLRPIPGPEWRSGRRAEN